LEEKRKRRQANDKRTTSERQANDKRTTRERQANDKRTTSERQATMTVQDIMNKLQKTGTEFVNDPDTIIGMQNQWLDYLRKDLSLDYNPEELKQAFNTTIITIPVVQEQYGEMDVYIGIRDGSITMSTKKWLL
jgi:hypothetical protein